MQKYLAGLAVSAAFLVPSLNAHAGTCEFQNPEATLEYTGMDGGYAQVKMSLSAPIRCEDEAPCETAASVGLVGGTCTTRGAMLGLEFENPQEFSCSVDDAKLSHGQSPAPEITLEHTGTVTPGHRYKGRYEAAMTINGCEADPSANWQSYPVRWTGSTGYISIPPVINSIQLFSFSDFEFHNRLVVGQSIQIMPQINAVKQTNTITLIVEGPGIPKRRIVFYGDGSSVADGISDIIPTEAGTLTLWVEVSGVRDDDEEETEDWTILSAPFYIPIATEACPAEGSTMDPNANCSGQTPGSDAGAGGETTDEEKDESSGCSAAGTGLSLLGVIPFALLGWKRRKHHSDFQND